MSRPPLGAGASRTAYAANGSFRDATAQQQLAIEKARALGWNTRTMPERLDAYRHGGAWRGDLLGPR